jgi:branched-chain amino acid transport system substrate-binding protein
MVASAGNLEYVLGPGPAGPATVPIILGTHTLDLALAPDPQFDNNTNPYFYRIFPSDSVGGTAIAAWGTLRRYKTAAVVFGEGQSQTEVPNLKRSFVRHGGRITWLKPLAEGQSSYRTAIEQIAATHPEVVFSELDNQTAATFWSEWLQLVGKLPRIVEGPTGASLPWIQTMIKTVGQAALVRDVVIVNNSAPNLSGPAYKQYAKLVPTVKAVADPSQFVGDPAGAEWFDTLQYTALAMDAARTTNPRVWRSYIREVTGAPRPGVTVVRTYAQGVAALKAGKRITYRGADGAYVFDSHNNLAAAFSGYVWEPAHKTLKQLAQLPTVTPGS